MVVKKRTAAEMAREMKEISFSEFIAANPHLVGFESSIKMLPMSIHELITNSLDACESAGILPEVWIDLKNIDEKGKLKRYRLVVRDNGPGIPPKNIPYVFGKLLYGSKFGVRKQSRGQQGIGVSAVVLISQLKTGEHTIVRSSTSGKTATVYEISVDVAHNRAIVHNTYKEKAGGWTGVEVSVVLEAQNSSKIVEYIELTAAINTHLTIHFDGISPEDRIEIERRTDELPSQPVETKPHPMGVDYDILKKIALQSRYSRLPEFLKGEFDQMRQDIVKDVIGRCKGSIDVKKHVQDLEKSEVAYLMEAMRDAKLPPPSAVCLSPVGEETLVKGVVSRLRPRFIEAVTRKPAAMRGQPFLVEVIIAYGCQENIGNDTSSLDPVTGVYVHRFVNRVPLLFSGSGDVIMKAARDAGLSRYEISPESSSHLFVHVAGVNIPYTSESKEAIKPVDEYYEEIRLAIQECGRKISRHIRQVKRAEEDLIRGKRKAIIHSLLLGQLNRYAGRKIANRGYAEAFGFDESLDEVLQRYHLDVFNGSTGKKDQEQPDRRAMRSSAEAAAAE
ncbi:DNA topoisomerase VI subunit B [Methanocella sp. CWC-04]|uniref:Type 2 DNA topoisomerase 6 subunit B n=1 Tax=Methanooceanicella nereidis TaxID=2052831 RepID=A0AAP2REZ7_9EURY|nr:DNA topoisomerase VI subunit B [Methanocella sp. CWC-04]MCD1295340.1 DNA topoisomerase VI subunit B [Methanocella sp. CWC-04]